MRTPAAALSLLLSWLAAACASDRTDGVGSSTAEDEHEHGPKARLSPPALAALLAQGRPSTGGAGSPPGGTTGSAGSFDTQGIWSGFGDWEPTVACSRDGRYVYQMTTRYGDPSAVSQPYVAFRGSLDGGNTWLPDQFIENKRAWEADPQVALSDDGTVFILWLSLFNPGVSFKKSSDHGKTWSTPIALAPPGPFYPPGWSDKPWLAVHPNGQDLFVGFNASDPYVVVSHNGGTSWSRPKRTANNGRYWYHTGSCVTPFGDVYFATADYSQSNKGKTYVNVTFSKDNGKTWNNTRVDTSEEMPGCSSVPGCYFGFLGPQSAIACDSAGTLAYVYNAGGVKSAPQQLWFSTSTDGVTWTTPQQISVANANVNNGFPQITAGPAPGDFRVSWQDDRAGGLWNTWFKETKDGGTSWSADVRLSNLVANGSYKHSSGYDFVFGDYNGMAVDDWGTNHVIWAEGASYNGPGNTWYTKGW